ncbi:MAG: nitronate monooxygenase family protein [Dehalococcoidales bacterium]|nr:nitronate monooxygenase family protein [Dehalococcoidales bacterium]
MFKTRITDLFGIKHPIIQGPLGGGLASVELVAAVSNAGGLGMITALNYGSSQELRDAIRQTRKLTDKPFAVNVTLLPTMRRIPYEEYFKAALDEGVRIFDTSGRSPEEFVPMVKQAGGLFMHKVGMARHAKTAERVGCDVVSVVCFESGGHPLPNDVGASVLIPACVDAVKIPVVQAAGVADGRGLVAALALGAEGILMGTRFVMSEECPFHPKLKEWFSHLTENDTMLVHRAINNNERVVRTPFTEKILALEESGAGLDAILPLISGEKVRSAYVTGDTSNAVVTAGQTVGLIHEVLPVREIIERMMAEAEGVMRKLKRINANARE